MTRASAGDGMMGHLIKVQLHYTHRTNESMVSNWSQTECPPRLTHRALDDKAPTPRITGVSLLISCDAVCRAVLRAAKPSTTSMFASSRGMMLSRCVTWADDRDHVGHIMWG